MGTTEYQALGSLRGNGDSLVLAYYSPPTSDLSAPDRLAVEQQELVRRTRLVTGLMTERYTRR